MKKQTSSALTRFLRRKTVKGRKSLTIAKKRALYKRAMRRLVKKSVRTGHVSRRLPLRLQAQARRSIRRLSTRFGKRRFHKRKFSTKRIHRRRFSKGRSTRRVIRRRPRRTRRTLRLSRISNPMLAMSPFARLRFLKRRFALLRRRFAVIRRKFGMRRRFRSRIGRLSTRMGSLRRRFMGGAPFTGVDSTTAQLFRYQYGMKRKYSAKRRYSVKRRYARRAPIRRRYTVRRRR